MDYVEARRQELLKSFADFGADALTRRPSPDAWSVAQILDHLAIVESGVARLITKRAAQARVAGLGEERSSESILSSFDAHAASLNSRRLDAPQTVLPRADVDPREAIAGLDSSRAALRAAVQSANGLALGEIKHTHPIAGELDLYQWLLFLGGHEERHTRQIQRTLRNSE